MDTAFDQLPPGVVIMMTGELSRYSAAMADFKALELPPSSGINWHDGVLIASGLNKGLAAMLAMPQMQWAWIMGDDHRFDRDILLRQLAKGYDASVPFCLHRKPPFATTIVDTAGGGYRWKLASEFPTSGSYKLSEDEVCGDAGLLLTRRVVEAIEPPWYDNRRSGAFSSDDLAFSKRIREAGFDIYVDLDVQLGHITPMTVTPVLLGGQWRVKLTAGEKSVAAIDPEMFRSQVDAKMRKPEEPDLA